MIKLSECILASKLLKGLSNPHRLGILCALANGEQKVSDINARLPLSQSALSQHLSVLRGLGLVYANKRGLEVYYQLAPGPALEIMQVLQRHFCKSKKQKGIKK